MHDVLDNGNIPTGTSDHDINVPDPAPITCYECSADVDKSDLSSDYAEPRCVRCQLIEAMEERDEARRMLAAMDGAPLDRLGIALAEVAALLPADVWLQCNIWNVAGRTESDKRVECDASRWTADDDHIETSHSHSSPAAALDEIGVSV